MEQEYGKCDVCENESTLRRKYFYYDFKCECHSPRHFEIVRHCKECTPKAPVKTTVHIKPIK